MIFWSLLLGLVYLVIVAPKMAGTTKRSEVRVGRRSHGVVPRLRDEAGRYPL